MDQFGAKFLDLKFLLLFVDDIGHVTHILTWEVCVQNDLYCYFVFGLWDKGNEYCFVVFVDLFLVLLLFEYFWLWGHLSFLPFYSFLLQNSSSPIFLNTFS